MTRRVPTTAGGGEVQLQLSKAAEIAAAVTWRVDIRKKPTLFASD